MPQPLASIRTTRIKSSGIADQLHKTIKLIGQGIRSGSQYQPLRLHVANLATRARRKDYPAQFGEVWNDFLNRWRYVRDPRGLETVTVSGPAIWNLTYGAASPTGKGHGDCDDATVAMGAAALALGLDARIVTMTSPGGVLPNHVYPEINFPGLGWIAADAVAYPKHGIGFHPPAIARERWDLYGRKIASTKGVSIMGAEYNGLEGWEGYGLESFGLAGTDTAEPASWSKEILDGPGGFGAFADTHGVLGGLGLLAEVEEDENGYARTPILEVSLGDFHYLRRNQRPYHGMTALGDDGSTYQYDALQGIFKKLFKAGKKLVKRVRKVARKVIKRIPGGKYLLKFHDKIHKISMKMIRPLNKLVGKVASKLAPIAALVPGYGPAISAALYTTGKISKIVSKVDAATRNGKIVSKKTGKPLKGKALMRLKSMMEQAARTEREQRKRGVLKAGSSAWKGKIARIGAKQPAARR